MPKCPMGVPSGESGEARAFLAHVFALTERQRGLDDERDRGIIRFSACVEGAGFVGADDIRRIEQLNTRRRRDKEPTR